MPRTPLEGPLLERIPERLRMYRRRRGLTQEQLASRAAVKPETISRLENGRLQPSLVVLARITRALECAMGDILDESSLGEDPEEERLLECFRRLEPGAREGLLALMEHR